MSSSEAAREEEGAHGAAAGGASQLEQQLARQVELAKSSNHKTGLTPSQVEAQFKIFGKNELPEKKKSKLLQFLGYLWGPMPIMIWVAILTEVVKAGFTNEGWEDFAVLLVLQFANATVGFIEENNAGNAIAALKSALRPSSCRATSSSSSWATSCPRTPCSSSAPAAWTWTRPR